MRKPAAWNVSEGMTEATYASCRWGACCRNRQNSGHAETFLRHTGTVGTPADLDITQAARQLPQERTE